MVRMPARLPIELQQALIKGSTQSYVDSGVLRLGPFGATTNQRKSEIPTMEEKRMPNKAKEAAKKANILVILG